jgi:[acyl-carrier-protein] S-malonyltransferase
LYDAFAESKAIFDAADSALGFSLSGQCFQGNPETLKQTIFSQPAILTVTIAAYEAFKARHPEIKPEYMAGLSLGEYSALIAAGVFPFAAGIKLVRRRAEIMEEASRRSPGKMAAVIGLTTAQVKDICLKTGAEIANLNSPEQIVISGKPESVDQAREAASAAGAKRVIELEVSGAFHSSLMFPASIELKDRIIKTVLTSPEVPVISNYTAHPQYRAVDIEENLVCQMYSPVRWEESMRYMLKDGVTLFYEFGPGKVLKGLMRKIDPGVHVICIEKAQDIREDLDAA